MRRFINGSEGAYTELEHQARGAAYVNFPSVELPPGAAPGEARIGFKIDPGSGVCTLFVELGVQYSGDHPAIRRWFEDGQISFPTFAEARRWICSELKAEFDLPAQTPGQATTLEREASPALASNSTNSNLAETIAGPADQMVDRLLLFLIKQTAQEHGLQVESVEPALLSSLCEDLRDKDASAFSDILDDRLGGASLSPQPRPGRAAVPRSRCWPGRQQLASFCCPPGQTRDANNEKEKRLRSFGPCAKTGKRTRGTIR